MVPRPQKSDAPRLVAALLRHGEYEQPEGVPSAHLPYPLTGAGRAQAIRAAATLRDLAQEHGLALHPTIESSPLLRAWQTAEAIARQLEGTLGGSFQVREAADLMERGLGSAANLTMAEIEEVLRADPRREVLAPGWKADPELRIPFPGAESMIEAGQRAGRLIEARMRELAGGRDAGDAMKVFVGHGGSFRFGAVHLGIMGAVEATRLSMFHCRPVLLELEPGGGWRKVGGDWKVRRTGVLAVD